MNLALTVRYDFNASHSLSMKETAHLHYFELYAEMKSTSPIQQGVIVNMVEVKEFLATICKPIAGTYLNTNSVLPPSAKEFPTTENISEFLWNECVRLKPKWPWSALTLVLKEPSGEEWGRVRVSV